MNKKDGRFQKGDGRKKKFSGERSFSSPKKERGREKSQFKRHENDGERSFSSAKKDGKPHKTASSTSDLLYGILPVLGALQHRRRRLEHLYLKKDAESSERLREIRILAEKIRVPVSDIPTTKLAEMCPDAVHQGVVLRCGSLPFSHWTDIPQTDEGTYPLYVALDQIEDPHNLGAILRTCGFFKVSAVVVPQDHTSGLTAVVAKASAGVSEWFPVVSVPNLARFLQEQKSKGLWVIGLDGEATDSVADFVRDRPLILVLGNEGRGIRQLVRKCCDWLVRIPGNPEVSSLNVSNAAAVTLYHLSH